MGISQSKKTWLNVFQASSLFLLSSSDSPGFSSLCSVRFVPFLYFPTSLNATMRIQRCCRSRFYQSESFDVLHSPCALIISQTLTGLSNLLKSKWHSQKFHFAHFIYKPFPLIRIWNVNASSPDFQLYVDFVEAISLTNYSNMGNLKPFANMSKFKSVDLLFIAREMRTQLQLTSAQFSHVMTEACRVNFHDMFIKNWLWNYLQAGLCQSSSKYYYLQNPYFKE